VALSADWDETLRRTGGTRTLGALVNGARLDQNQTPNQFGMFLRCVAMSSTAYAADGPRVRYCASVRRNAATTTV